MPGAVFSGEVQLAQQAPMVSSYSIASAGRANVRDGQQTRNAAVFRFAPSATV